VRWKCSNVWAKQELYEYQCRQDGGSFEHDAASATQGIPKISLLDDVVVSVKLHEGGGP
jgi:hypothetical protein